ncbi:hypothetical protein ACFQ4C_16395 [Larkinella insperata]|uniref:Mechanosensitive ion channel n=1 Tax=Larkinella insperata TaxID=332158 RepID=A0ABW3QK55_9BACT|nr:hypothetical protein [Larkinella insperata]
MDRVPAFVDILINTFTTLINQFIDFVPRIIGAAFIMAIGFGVAKALALLVSKLLDRVGINRIGDRLTEIDFIKRLKTEIKLSDIVSKVLYYFVLLIFLMAATETLGVSAITEMVKSLVDFIPRLIAAAIMLQVGVLVADALKGAVITLCQSFNIASGRLLGMIVFLLFDHYAHQRSGAGRHQYGASGIKLQPTDWRSHFCFRGWLRDGVAGRHGQHFIFFLQQKPFLRRTSDSDWRYQRNNSSDRSYVPNPPDRRHNHDYSPTKPAG